MDVKKYLSQAHYLDFSINSKLRQKEELKARTMKITTSFGLDKVSSSKQNSPMENAIVKMILMEQEINNDIDKLYMLKNEMELLILEIDDPVYRDIINLRYIKNKKWDEISVLLGYHVRWILKLHNRALIEAEKVLIKRSKPEYTNTGLIGNGKEFATTTG